MKPGDNTDGESVKQMSADTGWGGKKIFVVGLMIGIAWACLSPLIIYLSPWPFTSINNKIYDLKLSFLAKPELSRNIVHLDIDDQAIKKIGQWPWDRAMTAKIVDGLAEAGAKAIVFDIMFTSPGRSDEGDRALAEATSKSGRVVAAVGLIEGESWRRDDEGPEYRARVDAVMEKCWKLTVPSSYSLIQVGRPASSGLPLTPIAKAAQLIGHINATPDKDGIHRRIPLIAQLGDRVVPSLSLAALVGYLGARPEDVTISEEREIAINHANGVLRIPVDSRANLIINWRPAWESFDHYTALDLLEGERDQAMIERYKGKIVIVSIAWTGATDIGANPIEGAVLLSRVHSSALDTILSNRFIRSIPGFPVVVVLSVVALLAFLASSAKIRLSYAVFAACGFIALCAVLSMGAFWWAFVEIPIAEAYFVFVPAAAAFLICRAISVEKDRLMIRDSFGRYLSDEVVEEILKSPGGISLKAEIRDITILVTDLRGFTPMTEALEPTVVMKVINRYFERMTDIVMRHQGTVDEFTGDGMLVLFGAPRQAPDHTKKAVACALEMQEAMASLNAGNSAEGLPELQMGVGINSGPLIIGNIGSEKRKKYGAIGSAINIAFRTEAQTVGGEILITEDAYNRIDGSLRCGAPRITRLKGIAEPVRLFPVVGLET